MSEKAEILHAGSKCGHPQRTRRIFGMVPESAIKKKSGKYDSGLSCRWALFTA